MEGYIKCQVGESGIPSLRMHVNLSHYQCETGCTYNEAYMQVKTCTQVSLVQHGLDLSRSTHTWIFFFFIYGTVYEVYFPYDCLNIFL